MLAMPDGTRPANFYDAVGCRDIKGARHYLESSNIKITDGQAAASGLAAISHRQAGRVNVQEGRGWVTSRLVTADYAGQPLGDYEAWDLARCYAEADFPEGFHIDNYGDNNLHQPIHGAFGPWSMHTFQEFLGRHFSAAELGALGVGDPAQFDLRSGSPRAAARRLGRPSWPRRLTRRGWTIRSGWPTWSTTPPARRAFTAPSSIN